MKWAPPLEKSRLIGFSTSGLNIGNIIALSLGGWLCDEGFDDGWGSVFILFGLIGIVWSFLMILLNSDSPSTHKFISVTERDYIVESIGEIGSPNQTRTPWKKMLTSKPTLAVITCAFCFNWGNYVIYKFILRIIFFLFYRNLI